MSMAARRRVSRVLWKVFFGLGLLVVLGPFLFVFTWMILTSLKSGLQQTAWPPLFIFTPTLDNYRNVFTQHPFIRYTANSLIVSGSATIIGLVLGLPAAYGIARWNQHGLAFAILISRILPWIALLLPWFALFTQLQLTGTYVPLIVTHLIITTPLIIWIMISFFQGLPREIEDAATVDGCSIWTAFLYVAVPLTRPGAIAAGILGLIYSWNNFIFSLVLATPQTQTLPMAVYSFLSYNQYDWGGLAAAATLVTLPVLVITLFVQRYLVSGLTLGAVKG